MQQQQQHINMRNVYPRQQAGMAGMETMPQHGTPEWRQLLMQQQQQQQQQNAGFNSQLRPNFQHQGSTNRKIARRIACESLVFV